MHNASKDIAEHDQTITFSINDYKIINLRADYIKRTKHLIQKGDGTLNHFPSLLSTTFLILSNYIIWVCNQIFLENTTEGTRREIKMDKYFGNPVSNLRKTPELGNK